MEKIYTLKLQGYHIDFDLNLKINHHLCLMLKKAFITKQTVPETFDFFGLICCVRHFRPTQNTGGRDNRNFELKVSFCHSPIC